LGIERVKMTEKIFYGEDGIRKEAKGEKLEYILQAQAEAQEQQRLLEVEIEAKEQLKQSAIAKLAAIGLTEEEAKIIIGIG
jgi:5-carboxymethyl-2-hydroxymuconate isomerase